MIIAIDFDGTIVEQKYPYIGTPLAGAIEGIQHLKNKGHIIIINSCRAGAYAELMRRWLFANNVPFDFINENDPRRTAQYGGDTRKISADIYIDDKNIFCRGINWNKIIAEIDSLTP